jgi:hypothetical protein
VCNCIFLYGRRHAATQIITGTVSNSKDMAAFPLKLEPNSPYEPLQSTFVEVFRKGGFIFFPSTLCACRNIYLLANADPVRAELYARNVVNEVLQKRPRAVMWTGGSAFSAWILVLFFPRFIIVSYSIIINAS